MTPQRILFLFLFVLCVSLAGAPRAIARKERPKPAVEINLDVLDAGGVRDPDLYSRIAPASGTKGADYYIPHELPSIEPELLPMPEFQPEPMPQADFGADLRPTRIIDPQEQQLIARKSEPTPIPGKRPAILRAPESFIEQARAGYDAPKQAKAAQNQARPQDISEDLLVQPSAQDVLNSLEN